MDLKAKKNFSSNLVGNVAAGQILKNVSGNYAAHLCDYGLCEPVKGAKSDPGPLSSGPAKQSLSSPAGQASKRGSLITSESIKNPEPAGLSESTQPASDTDTPTASTQPTEFGGNATKKRRGRPRKK